MTVFDLGWAVGDTVGDIRGFDTFVAGRVDFGGEIGAFSTGDFSSTVEFTDVGTGNVGVVYPVEVTLGIPDPDTFRDGQVITIPSSFILRDGAALTTAAPRGGIDVRLSAAMAAGAHSKVCIFGCTSFPLLPAFSFGESNMQLFSLGVDPDGQDFAQLFGLGRINLPHELTFIESEISGLSGKFGLPKVHTASSVLADQRSLSAFGRDTFFNIKLDIDGFLTLKIPLGFETPDFHGAKMKYETVDLSAVFRIFQDQSFTFTPRVYATLVFPQPVHFWEVDGGGNDIAEGIGSTITFQVGNTLKMVYPAGLRTPMTIEPTFSIRNQFTSRTTNEFREDLELTVGEFQLKLPSFELFPSVTTDACHFATVTLDVADIIPDESCPVTTPAVTSPEINIDLGPLYHTSLFGLQQSQTLFPFAADDCAPGSDGCSRWELAGFNTVPGASIVLDPENPVIGVTTTLASALSTGTGPAGTLTQSITVTNEGDVPLTAAQVLDALAIQITGGGGFGVRTIVSPQLTENASFNGVGDLGTLTRADILAVGGSGNIAINFAVQPGNIFTTTLDADGTSQIVGTTVRAHAEASFGVFAFDVRPSSTNQSPNGVLPVVVLSTPGMDASAIDPTTARLEGVAPLRWEVVPRGALNDLTLKFDRQAIVAALQQRLAAGPVAVAAIQQPAPPPRYARPRGGGARSTRWPFAHGRAGPGGGSQRQWSRRHRRSEGPDSAHPGSHRPRNRARRPRSRARRRGRRRRSTQRHQPHRGADRHAAQRHAVYGRERTDREGELTMNRTYRWTAILSALVLPAVSSCGDAPLAPKSPVPGALIVSLEGGDGTSAGAILFRVKGEQISDVVAINPAHSVFTQHSDEDGGSWLVAVIGRGTPVTGSLFSFSVPDVTQPGAYDISLVEVADEANNVRPDVSGYRLDVLRKQ